MTVSSTRTLVSCGVDIGTTNTKVVAIDRHGAVVARAGRATPRDLKDLSVDADALVDAIEDMILEVCADRFCAATVATAGIGEDGVLVDASMQPLSRALAWFDPRRERLFREIADELEPIDGLPVETDSSRTIVGWRWAAAQVGPGSASTWVALADFAGARWTGRAFMSDTLAARTAAWSAAHRAWIGSRVDVTLGDRRMLPEVLHTGEIVGPWRSSRLSGAGVLTAASTVVGGGHDHPVGGWGVDRAHPGAVLDSMGTAEVVVAQTPIHDAPRVEGVDVAPGIRQPGTTLLGVQELARNMDWASQDPEVGRLLRAIVAGEIEPDSALLSGAFVPGPAGGVRPRYERDAPHSPLSRASAVAGALATLGEGTIARVAAQMAPGAQTFAAGGWARSSGWIRVKQLVTGRTLTLVPEPEVTAVGAALLAAEAMGWTPSAEVALSGASAQNPAGRRAG